MSGGPFIAWIGRFPGEKRAGTLVTDVGMAVETFLPKLRGPGARLGSAEPGVRPTPHCRLWPPSFARSLVGGPSSVVVEVGCEIPDEDETPTPLQQYVLQRNFQALNILHTSLEHSSHIRESGRI